ncbi:hypothetical protein GCM10009765_84300 [Fodinicola feengrottensis]|uniref:Exo-alpha-sialidase n=1 Tax=Fodinicola feengrottensis TaxID=435914 RepID=A0ABN2JDM6_9ACTN
MIDSTDYAQTRERIHELLVDPDLSQIHRRGNRRRFGRKAAIGTASVAAIGVAVLVATQVIAPHPTATPAGPKAITGPLHGPPVSLSGKSQLLDSQPVDGKRSYALIKTANGKYAVARTQDTGATWQAWQLPPSMPTRNVPVLYVDQSDSLVVSASGPPSGTAKVSQDGKQVSVDGGKTWEANVGQLGQLISQDGGQTWRPSGLPGTTGRPIEKLAPGWSAQTSGGKVFGSDPAAGGALHPLVHQPQVATRCMGVTEAADESVWLECVGANGAFVLQVSHDRGVTWDSAAVPGLIERGGPGAGGCGQLIDSYDGKTGYAYGYTAASNGKESGLVITHDGGKTWSTTVIQLPQNLGTCPTATATGSLVGEQNVNANGDNPRLIVSTDSGRTFTQVSGVSQLGTVNRMTGSASLVARDPRKGAWTSSDGVHWTPALVPPHSTRS